MEHQPDIILGKPQVTSLDLSLFGVSLSPGSCPESESDSESASKSRTPTPGTRPVSSVVLDTKGRPVDRLLIKNVENFYFLFDGFPYVIAPVFSTPAFSIHAIYSCIFYSRIFSASSTTACSSPPAFLSVCRFNFPGRPNV